MKPLGTFTYGNKEQWCTFYSPCRSQQSPAQMEIKVYVKPTNKGLLLHYQSNAL